MDGSVTFLSVSPNWDAPIDVGEAETAAQAWQKLCNLQRSDEVIRFIKVISGGTSLEREDYFVAVAASCGRWRVEGRESRRADTRESLQARLRLFENREQTLTTSIGPICPAISALSSHAEGRLATGNADRSERVKNDLPFGTCEQQQGQQQPRLGSVQDAAVDQAALQQIGF